MSEKKYLKDGMVAVLYSPGYGAGWYSWNTENKQMLFDTELVQLVLDKASEEKLLSFAEAAYPDCYVGGASQLQVKWVKEGTRFRIHEYDGSESVVELDLEDFTVA